MTRPSDAPVRRAGSHTRSGNAMLRTRTAILAAAAECVARAGVRRTTMSDVSEQAKIAKATLYNHFRTKDDLLAAVVEARIEQLTAECSQLATGGLRPALEHAGGWLAGSAALHRLAADEPAVLALIGRPTTGRLWELAREGTATVLHKAGAPRDAVAVDLVLRWLCGHAMWAGRPEELVLGARLLADGLGRAVEPDRVLLLESQPAEPATPVPSNDTHGPSARAGVGWPA